MIRCHKTVCQGYTPHKYTHRLSNHLFYSWASFNHLEVAYRFSDNSVSPQCHYLSLYHVYTYWQTHHDRQVMLCQKHFKCRSKWKNAVMTIKVIGFQTFFLHAGPEAFVESAETTLVPLIFIHNALPAEPASNEHKNYISNSNGVL